MSRVPRVAMLAAVLLWASASRAAVLTAGNGVYTISIADQEEGSCGTWTAVTGALHPAGANQNLLYGGGLPGTSNTVLRSYTSETDYSTGAACSPLCGADTPLVESIFSGETTVGYRFTWSITDGERSVDFIQEVVVQGPVDGTETVDNTVIRETHTVRNAGPGSLTFGLRKMWDWQIGLDDGPWFGSCESPSAACDRSMNLTADGSLNGAYPRSFVINDDPDSAACPGGLIPNNPAGCGDDEDDLYIVAGTVEPPSALDPSPDEPEILQFNEWASLSGTCWLPELSDNALCGALFFPSDDTATGYFYGLDGGIVLESGQERSFTQYIVAGEGSCPDPLADTNPPLCAGSAGIDPVLGDGSATEFNAGDSGIASVALAPGAVNAILVVDEFTPGVLSVTFHVEQGNPGREAQATVVVTDGVGQTCEVTFGTVPEGPTNNEVLCLEQGILVSASNASETPAGNASCSSNEPNPGDPPLPPGYEPSPEDDETPCTVMTIDSPLSGATTLVYKKDGTFDTRYRLLFSRFDGEIFPPFTDITESVIPITDIIPDPVRLQGTPTLSLIKVTCALLTEVCDGVDNDGDGVIDEELPVDGLAVDFDEDGFPLCPASPDGPFDCNDQIASIRPGASETCNGLDDDCDTSIDEGNPGGGSACLVDGKLGACAAGLSACMDGALACAQTGFPATEVCDGVDNDCDGEVDNGVSDATPPSVTCAATPVSDDDEDDSQDDDESDDDSSDDEGQHVAIQVSAAGAGDDEAQHIAIQVSAPSSSDDESDEGSDDDESDDDSSDDESDDDSDDDEGDEDRRVIGFSAADDCGEVSVSAVIQLAEQNGSCTPIPVILGQIVEVDCDDEGCETGLDEGCETGLDDGILEVEAASATLLVTATDAAGNTSSCSVDLCQSSAGDEIEEHLDQCDAGTVVGWNPVAGDQSYDVVRGRVADLRVEGAAVVLGSVACIEADSADGSTAGSEDPAQPAAGDVFFYLVRHGQGAGGPYGTDSAGRLRVAEGGDCP